MIEIIYPIHNFDLTFSTMLPQSAFNLNIIIYDTDKFVINSIMNAYQIWPEDNQLLSHQDIFAIRFISHRETW